MLITSFIYEKKKVILCHYIVKLGIDTPINIILMGDYYMTLVNALWVSADSNGNIARLIADLATGFSA
jgi:hypothetical protein